MSWVLVENCDLKKILCKDRKAKATKVNYVHYFTNASMVELDSVVATVGVALSSSLNQGLLRTYIVCTE